jgi:hypothetical protein
MTELKGLTWYVLLIAALVLGFTLTHHRQHLDNGREKRNTVTVNQSHQGV